MNCEDGEMTLKCRECRECNGIACRGEIPGVGGKDTGRSFIRNVEAFRKVRINMDVCAEPGEISTGTEILGVNLSVPVFMAPVAGIRNNYGADIDEYDYNCMMLDGCDLAGIRGFTGDGIDIEGLFAVPARAVNDHDGHGIVTIKPWVREGVDARIEILSKLKFDMAAMDIDAAGLPLLRAGKTPVETKTAEELRYIRNRLGKPFIVKGVMTVHAAQTAVEAGCDAIVVSNHGGRVLDDTPGTIEVLPEIAAAVKGKTTILLDGGVRTGNDIFKALALGADGVLIGRPLALACVKGGAEGIRTAVEDLQRQLKDTMLMTGCHCIADITAEKVRIVD
ncbi:MAG: alpha-hydroxy-acid oxidizing protein [Solobacterium sp.]|nr:alpha-hydroxy-acid oxidizing protein [Solobacterium sp.]